MKNHSQGDVIMASAIPSLNLNAFRELSLIDPAEPEATGTSHNRRIYRYSLESFINKKLTNPQLKLKNLRDDHTLTVLARNIEKMFDSFISQNNDTFIIVFRGKQAVEISITENIANVLRSPPSYLIINSGINGGFVCFSKNARPPQRNDIVVDQFFSGDETVDVARCPNNLYLDREFVTYYAEAHFKSYPGDKERGICCPCCLHNPNITPHVITLETISAIDPLMQILKNCMANRDEALRTAEAKISLQTADLEQKDQAIVQMRRLLKDVSDHLNGSWWVCRLGASETAFSLNDDRKAILSYINPPSQQETSNEGTGLLAAGHN
jgi:hypothetical protein